MERLFSVEKCSGLSKQCGKEDTETVLTLGQDENLLSEEVDKELDSETEDESDEDEIAMFLSLMNNAEKKNKKKASRKMKNYNSRTDWRQVNMTGPDEDSSDTDDEDDRDETNMFLTMMDAAKKKNSKVTIKWVAGKVRIEKDQDGLEGEIVRRKNFLNEEQENRLRKESASKVTMTMIRQAVQSSKDKELSRRKEEFRQQQVEGCGAPLARSNSGGKRKYEDRMTLDEAKVEDFDGSQDYVNFLQSKLQGVKIKLIK